MDQTVIRNTQLSLTHTVSSSDLNQYGIMHGGRLLTLCDEAGYLSAFNHAGSKCLTRAVHQARFHNAAKLGENLVFCARTGLTGFSSLWVEVTVTDSEETVIMDAVFVFAAVDEQGQSKQVPAVVAESKEEMKLHARLKAMRKLLTSSI